MDIARIRELVRLVGRAAPFLLWSQLPNPLGRNSKFYARGESSKTCLQKCSQNKNQNPQKIYQKPHRYNPKVPPNVMRLLKEIPRRRSFIGAQDPSQSAECPEIHRTETSTESSCLVMDRKLSSTGGWFRPCHLGLDLFVTSRDREAGIIDTG